MSKMKSLFEMSKKTVITLACLAAAVAVIGTGTAYAVRAAAERNSIGKATAERFALADAGVDMSSALVSKAEFLFRLYGGIELTEVCREVRR